MTKRFLIALPDKDVAVLEALVSQEMAASRNALIQRIVSSFISDLRDRRPEQNPDYLKSALGALAGVFLFGLGIAVLNDIFGGDK